MGTKATGKILSTDDGVVWRQIIRDVTPNIEVRRAQAALEAAIEESGDTVSCKNRYREFKDYAKAPNPYQAKLMCADCPIMGTGLCLAFGLAEREHAKRKTGEKITGIHEGVTIEHYKG